MVVLPHISCATAGCKLLVCRTSDCSQSVISGTQGHLFATLGQPHTLLADSSIFLI